MTVTRNTQYAVSGLICVVIAAIWGIAWFAPSIGLYHDDAVYLVTAKALAGGRGYTLENLPVPIPQTKYPPLFPVLLASFVRISGNPQWLKLLPLLCAAAWLMVSYKLLRRMGAEHASALLLVGMTAAAPPVVFLSTNLMSESLFALLVAASLLALLDDRMIPAGVLAGLATLTRTAGLPLIAACVLTLLIRGRLRPAIRFTAAAIVLIAPWFGWAMAHGSADAYYSGGNYAASNILTSLAMNEKAAVIGTNLLFLFTSPFSLLSGLSDMYAALFTFLLTLYCFWKRRQMLPDLFLLLYCGMLLCWPGPPQRFLAPLLPMILWLYWRVLGTIRRVEPRVAIGLVLLLLPIVSSVRRLPETVQTGQFPTSPLRPTDWKALNSLFAGVRANTPPDAILAANLDPLFYLNTGRKAIRAFVPNGYRTFYEPHGQAVTPDELYATLLRNGVTYVALTPDRDFAEAAAYHKSVEALERGGRLEAVTIPGLAREYRLLRMGQIR